MSKIKLNPDKKQKIKNGLKEHGKLPLTFKKKWLKALRSGKYAQGATALRDGTRYCCLGVACHIAGATGIKDKGYIENGAKSKIKSINKVPKLLHGEADVPNVLAHLNDTGNTFEQIADVIEKYL